MRQNLFMCVRKFVDISNEYPRSIAYFSIYKFFEFVKLIFLEWKKTIVHRSFLFTLM